MWEKWKKVISRLFFKEVAELEELEQKPRDINSLHDQDVHTKITHKYPNRTSFRFPVISDQPNQSDIDKSALEREQKNLDRPAYARKRSEREKPDAQQKMNKNKQYFSGKIAEYDNSDVAEQKRGTQESPTGMANQKTENSKNPSVEKQSFQPTDVPSPIYGFQKRKQEKEDVEEPAYLRKQQLNNGTELAASKSKGESHPVLQKEEKASYAFNSQTDDESHTILQKEENAQSESMEPAYTESFTSENFTKDLSQQVQASTAEEPSGETVSESESVAKNTENNQPERVVESDEGKKSGSERAIESNETKKSAPEQVIESDEAKKPAKKNNPVHSTTKERPGKKNQSDRSQPDKQQTNQSIPFNVMMSANDKRKYRERKQSSENSRKIKNDDASIPYYLLDDPVPKTSQDQLWMANQQELLEKTLKYFHVKAKVVRATQGPSVTRFEVQPEMGVKVSKIKNLSDDLKLNMAAKDIRIEAPIPGKNTVGIEIPNSEPQMVGLQEIFATDDFQKNPSLLTIALGLTIEGSPAITTINKMPHGLIAGATGSGKSVCINTILVSLIYKASHRDVKFMLIDPKMVELAPFNHIPHLVAPVITDVKAATQALKWAVNEMEDRYEKFVEEGVRDVERYNEKMLKQNRPDDKMPFMVIVIDELADLMMMSPQDVEDAICRIAQKARACGIHLLLATQRPSVDVITGLIKANIPTRIAFSVSSQVDSRTIMDANGAEKLLGKGDMLFSENGAGKSVRLQGAFVSDDEIERVAKHARSIAPTEYAFEQEDLLEQIAVENDDEDSLLEQAIAFVVEQNNASTSLLQRHFKIGYNRAARLMDTMETKGIISQQNGSKPREVLVSGSQLSGQS